MKFYSIKKLIKKEFYSKSIYNNVYINTKISPYNEILQGNKRLTKDKYYEHSLLLLKSICEVENKYYPQTFLDKFFVCNSIEKHSSNNVNSLFKELVEIVDWSDDDESSDKS